MIIKVGLYSTNETDICNTNLALLLGKHAKSQQITYCILGLHCPEIIPPYLPSQNTVYHMLPSPDRSNVFLTLTHIADYMLNIWISTMCAFLYINCCL